MDNYLKIRGARQHNLKNINLDIPKNKLVVFTGLSGSGKSSLAFDTIYAEGQRRYVESLSSYARQFLGIMDKPDVDSIEGLSPSISIDQKGTSHNPRSTVGTITEIYDYMRLLFARIGHPHCPICSREISSQSLDQIVDALLENIVSSAKANKKAWYYILSPVVNDKKGEFTNLFENLKAKGFQKVRIDGIVNSLDDDLVLIKTNKHTIDIIVDTISLIDKNTKDDKFISNLRSRISESVELSLSLSDGMVKLCQILDSGFEIPKYPKKFSDKLYSQKFSCPVDNISLPEIEPRTFSFNSPHGACPNCSGLGKILKADPNLIFSPEISIMEGGILPFSTMFENDTWYSRLILTVCNQYGINPRVPIGTLTQTERDLLLYGTGSKEYKVSGENKRGKLTSIYWSFRGITNELERRYQESESDWVKDEVKKYLREQICTLCNGTRLKKESLSITITQKSIHDIATYSISKSYDWISSLITDKLISEKEIQIAELIIKEIKSRLHFLISVGLDYLTLGREAMSLSGGEAQRIRLASQIGSGLTGVLYILDEPTIGLHQKDNNKLIDTLKKLRDLGNTVIVVEHDREMIESADHVIDFGPQAGDGGGMVVAQGKPSLIKKSPKSITGKYLSGKYLIKPEIEKLTSYSQRLISNKIGFAHFKNQDGKSMEIIGCQTFNLKNINVSFPLAKFVCITGVSGSGKSSLLVETLYPALQSYLNPHYRGNMGVFSRLEGKENIDKIILIDQSPIGRTPRSNPATYTGLFDPIREVFAATRSAKTLGFGKGRFSFNVRGGRCESCEGQGLIKIEMQFMSDIWITCDICKGTRYNHNTLEVEYQGKNITNVLNLTVNEALEFFRSHPKILAKLETLSDVGLGYIRLGQPATTLSGGEAQRVKLATELSKKSTGSTVYILDEPTTGLHFADVEKLLTVLKLLVDRGNSVFLIEHNLDVIKNADWIIDLGPGGGIEGGNIVAQGKPEDIIKINSSHTGKYLKNVLKD